MIKNIKNKTFLTLLLVVLMQPLYATTEKIAYLSYHDYFWQLWVMQPDGTNKDQVTHSKSDKVRLSWYPDGIHMLLNDNNGQVTKINIVTKKETRIEFPIRGTLDAVISPDGEYIAFSLSVADSIDNNHIWLVNKEGKQLKKLTNMPGLQHEPSWSPDMSWIYFLSGVGDQSHDIWRVSVEGDRIEKITDNQLYNFDIALSQNNTMAFSSNRSGNYDIWIRDGLKKPQQLTQHNGMDSRPSWSHDGSKLVFESSRNGAMNIFKLDINEGSISALTNEIIGARYPVWWPLAIGAK